MIPKIRKHSYNTFEQMSSLILKNMKKIEAAEAQGFFFGKLKFDGNPLIHQRILFRPEKRTAIVRL